MEQVIVEASTSDELVYIKGKWRFWRDRVEHRSVYLVYNEAVQNLT
jgi:hypothetical protein